MGEIPPAPEVMPRVSQGKAFLYPEKVFDLDKQNEIFNKAIK
jgi:hypothetical protein